MLYLVYIQVKIGISEVFELNADEVTMRSRARCSAGPSLVRARTYAQEYTFHDRIPNLARARAVMTWRSSGTVRDTM